MFAFISKVHLSKQSNRVMTRVPLPGFTVKLIERLPLPLNVNQQF